MTKKLFSVAKKFQAILSKTAQPAELEGGLIDETGNAGGLVAEPETESQGHHLPDEMLSTLKDDFRLIISSLFEKKLSSEFPEALAMFFNQYAQKAKLYTGAKHRYTPSDMVKNITYLQYDTPSAEWPMRFRTTDGQKHTAIIGITFLDE